MKVLNSSLNSDWKEVSSFGSAQGWVSEAGTETG